MGIRVASVVIGAVVVFGSVVGSGGEEAEAAPRLPRAAGWDGKSTFSCDRGSHVFEGLDVEVRGVGVSTSGTCRVVLKNCKISATHVGISSSGSSSVVLQGGQVSGLVGVSASGSSNVDLNNAKVSGAISVMASGSANVDARSATLAGRVDKSGSATVRR